MDKETYALLELIVLLLLFDVAGFGIGWLCRGKWEKDKQEGR